MEQIKEWMKQLLQSIDSGVFLREPMKWIYMLYAVLQFVLPLCFLYLYYQLLSSKFSIGFLEGWDAFVMYLSMFLVVAWQFALAYTGFVYWKKRKEHLGREVRNGDSMVAIPVWAHYIQCSLEWTGIYLFVSVVGTYVIFFVCALLTGFDILGGSEAMFKGFLIGVLILIALIIIFLPICYLIILLAHYIGEQMRVKAQLANDLRDVSDIQRAMTMPEEVQEVSDDEDTETI